MPGVLLVEVSHLTIKLPMNTTKTFALITGASAGIGKSLAIELAKRKINLLLVALPHSGLSDVAENLKSIYSIETHYMEIDLIQPDAAETIFNWCKVDGYRIQFLINNAGIGNFGSFEETEVSLLNTMMILNNHALVKLTHRFIPELRENDVGYILNVSSLASFMPIPNKSLYVATKSFVYSFSTALALELRPHNICVCCVCPGGTRTSKDMLERSKKVNWCGMDLSQSAFEVAQETVAKMMEGRSRVIVPGWQNKTLLFLRNILPSGIVHYLLQQLFASKSKTSSQSPAPVFLFNE